MRGEILGGALEPGARLRTEELRERYAISGSTIREALTRLLGEALVTAEGQRGFRVAPASLVDFQDLTAVRKLVETEALRQAIEAGGEAWESEIVAAFYRISKTEERLREDPAGAAGGFELRNRHFHRALISACPSPWLHRLHALLYQHSERYRRMVVSSPRHCARRSRRTSGIFDATCAQHRACMQAGRRAHRTVGRGASDSACGAGQTDGELGGPAVAAGGANEGASRFATRTRSGLLHGDGFRCGGPRAHGPGRRPAPARPRQRRGQASARSGQGSAPDARTSG